MDEFAKKIRIRVKFRDLTDNQVKVIANMRADGKIICLIDHEEAEEVGLGYDTLTKTYHVLWIQKVN